MSQQKLFDWNPKQNFEDDIDIEPRLPDIIISLFEHSGFASLYWRMAGYQVIQIDTKIGIDIMDWNYRAVDHNRVYGLMAFPPCTHFASSGAQYWPEKDKDGRTDEAVALVERTLEIKDYCMPKFWFVENPVGRISDLVPELGDPWYFHPYEYGDPWKKKTALYGRFRPPAKNPVKPLQKIGANGEKYSVIHMNTGGKSEKTKIIRSLTPTGFAKAFYKANKPKTIKQI